MYTLTERERMVECWPELDELAKEARIKAPIDDGTPELDINWPLYITMQSTGTLVNITAREDSLLIGFVNYFVMMHPHHQTMMVAQSDMLATRVGYKGKGIGKDLVQCGEFVLKDKGVKLVTHLFRTCFTSEPLFTKLGYKLVEQCYRKEL